MIAILATPALGHTLSGPSPSPVVGWPGLVDGIIVNVKKTQNLLREESYVNRILLPYSFDLKGGCK